jgi:hypothetical protein
MVALACWIPSAYRAVHPFIPLIRQDASELLGRDCAIREEVTHACKPVLVTAAVSIFEATGSKLLTIAMPDCVRGKRTPECCLYIGLGGKRLFAPERGIEIDVLLPCELPCVSIGSDPGGAALREVVGNTLYDETISTGGNSPEEAAGIRGLADQPEQTDRSEPVAQA